MFIFFILVLFSIVPCAYANNAITLNAYAAWDGYIKYDAQEEITLRIYANQALPVKIEVQDNNNMLVTHMDLLPDKINVTKLEMPNIKGERLYVSVTSTETKSKVTKIIDLHPIKDDTKLIAIASNNPDIYDIIGNNNRFTLITPSMALFPDNAQAYRSISAIIIDDSTFSNFTNNQLSALQQYASTCGSIFTYRLNKQYLHALKNNSYCNINNIHTLIHASLENIKSTNTRNDTSQIMQHVLKNNAQHYILAHFLLGIVIIMMYFGTILFMAYFSLPIRVLVYSSILSTFAIYTYYAYLYQGNLETDTLIKINQYGTGTQTTQLLAIGGHAINKTITLPSALGIACPADSNLAYKLRYATSGHYQISYKQALFKPYQFQISGPISYKPAIHIFSAQNKLWLTNISNEIIPQGIIKWENSYMYFKELAPHASFRVNPAKHQQLHNIFAKIYSKLLHTCKHCAVINYTGTKTILRNKAISSHQVILVYL